MQKKHVIFSPEISEPISDYQYMPEMIYGEAVYLLALLAVFSNYICKKFEFVVNIDYGNLPQLQDRCLRFANLLL